MKAEYNQNENEIAIPEIPPFDAKNVKWQQQGYQLIATSESGVRFGINLPPNVRLTGIDKNNNPLFSKIDR